MKPDKLSKKAALERFPVLKNLHSTLRGALSFENGAMLDHPLLVTALNSPITHETVEQLNLTFKNKRSLANNYKRKRCFREYLYLFERSHRLEAFLEINALLADHWYWKLLLELWMECENPQTNLSKWRAAFESERPCRALIMNKQERTTLAHLPELFPVYRAGGLFPTGLNWTIDPKVAISLTGRSPDYYAPRLYTAWATKLQVVGYIARRGKHEIIVDSGHLRYPRWLALHKAKNAASQMPSAFFDPSSGSSPNTAALDLHSQPNDLAMTMWSIAIKMRDWTNNGSGSEALRDLLFGSARMGIPKMTAVQVLENALDSIRNYGVSRKMIMSTANSRYTSATELLDASGVKPAVSQAMVNLARLRAAISKKQWTPATYVTDLRKTVQYTEHLRVSIDDCVTAIALHLDTIGLPYNKDVLDEQVLDVALGHEITAALALD